MGLVRTWTGQVARAAGASLLAPLVLLLAAGLLASAGGVGAFGSLGEISSGPSLPDIGLPNGPGSPLEDAQIVGAELPLPAATPIAPGSPTGALASAAPPARSPDAGEPRTPPSTRPGPSGDSFELEAQPPGTGGAIPPGAPSPPTQTPAAPAEDLGEVTRGLAESLRAPLEPLTNAILELLRGPPRR